MFRTTTSIAAKLYSNDFGDSINDLAGNRPNLRPVSGSSVRWPLFACHRCEAVTNNKVRPNTCQTCHDMHCAFYAEYLINQVGDPVCRKCDPDILSLRDLPQTHSSAEKKCLGDPWLLWKATTNPHARPPCVTFVCGLPGRLHLVVNTMKHLHDRGFQFVFWLRTPAVFQDLQEEMKSTNGKTHKIRKIWWGPSPAPPEITYVESSGDVKTRRNIEPAWKKIKGGRGSSAKPVWRLKSGATEMGSPFAQPATPDMCSMWCLILVRDPEWRKMKPCHAPCDLDEGHTELCNCGTHKAQTLLDNETEESGFDLDDWGYWKDPDTTKGASQSLICDVNTTKTKCDHTGQQYDISHWETSYHGTWFYGLGNLITHGILASESNELGHGILDHTPGVYTSPTYDCAWGYATPHLLFDSVTDQEACNGGPMSLPT